MGGMGAEVMFQCGKTHCDLKDQWELIRRRSGKGIADSKQSLGVISVQNHICFSLLSIVTVCLFSHLIFPYVFPAMIMIILMVISVGRKGQLLE